MSENTLETYENRGYKNLDLTKMGNEDSIIVEKRYDNVRVIEGEKDYNDGKGPKKWTLYSCGVIYNGEEVSFLLPKTHSAEDKIVDPKEYADKYDALGDTGTKVKITCKKEMSKAAYDFKPKFASGEDIVKLDYVLEVVE